ncbi:hypothetical protein N7513_008468 [Penicillium frequentans]|nr:hypothetical protein N7513_008468 [Penicillium glabrum]
MRATWFLASTLAAFAAADASTTTVSYLGAAADGDVDLSKYTSVAAEVIAVDATATTYDIRCQSGVAKSLCAIDSKTPFRLIQGPTTYSFSAYEAITTQGGTADVFATVACSFTHVSESVSCRQSISMDISAEGYSTATSTYIPSQTIEADQVSYHVLTVTAGVEALKAYATATSPVTASGAEATASGADSTASGADSTASAADSTVSAAKSTGAAHPMITAAPMAFAAVAAAAAAML